MMRTSGGQPGHVVTAETRTKISAALKGRKQGPNKRKGRPMTDEKRALLAHLSRKYDPVCSITGCGNAHMAKGFCSTHYRRFRLYGDPHATRVPRGADNPNWKGCDIGYDALHRRLKNTLERSCAACGVATGRLEAALLRTATSVKNNSPKGPYSLNPDDYVTLCVTCHRRYDSPRPETSAAIEEALASNGA